MKFYINEYRSKSSSVKLTKVLLSYKHNPHAEIRTKNPIQFHYEFSQFYHDPDALNAVLVFADDSFFALSFLTPFSIQYIYSTAINTNSDCYKAIDILKESGLDITKDLIRIQRIDQLIDVLLEWLESEPLVEYQELSGNSLIPISLKSPLYAKFELISEVLKKPFKERVYFLRKLFGDLQINPHSYFKITFQDQSFCKFSINSKLLQIVSNNTEVNKILNKYHNQKIDLSIIYIIKEWFK